MSNADYVKIDREEVKQVTEDAKKKMMARIGVAAGVTMLIVSFTGRRLFARLNASSAAPTPPVAASAPPLAARPAAALSNGAVRPGSTTAVDFAGSPVVAEEASKDSHVASEPGRGPLGQPPSIEEPVFNHALYVFKAFAYATGLVIASFAGGIYLTCLYYDAWDPELLTHDLKTSFRSTFLPSSYPNSEPSAILEAIRARRLAKVVQEPAQAGDRDAPAFSPGWWRQLSQEVEEESRSAYEERQARVARLIEEREERRARRRAT